MNAYFFKMNKQERDNILDQHKQVYDGYVTRYNNQSNETPLYIQDLANDKGGITLNNKGVVKPYTNIGINESALDHIGDGPRDLKNGTVDLDAENPKYNQIKNLSMHDEYPSPSEVDEYYSTFDTDMEQNNDQYEYDIDELEDYSAEDISEEYEDLDEQPTLDLEDVDEEILPEFIEELNESLNMFKRFQKYN